MNNLEVWNKVKQPPAHALKTIQGGRLKNMTDINPQWRYQVMTETFGMCGFGWKYEIVNLWTEAAPDEQKIGFAQILLYIKQGEKWSDGIPGVGGSMLVSKEQAGLHTSDEVYKMAITDALGVAMKMLGIAADIYAGLFDGTKYKVNQMATAEDLKEIKKVMEMAGWNKDAMVACVKLKGWEANTAKELTHEQAQILITGIRKEFEKKQE